MNTIGHILVVLMTLGAVAQAAEPEKSPAILLQEALYQEETAGDLDKAIELYGQVLEQAADVERLAARATYQLGLCHLKKGDETTAAQYFRKAVNEYPKQTSVVKKAQEQLDKIAPPETEGILFEKIPEDAALKIANMYGQTCSKAGMNNLYTNSHIHFVNADFVDYSGGYGYYTNQLNIPLTQKVRLSGTGYPNQYHYDIAGRKMNTEIVPDKDRPNFYHIYWTPDEPLPPGQFFMYGWCGHKGSKLPMAPGMPQKGSGQKYTLTMQNHFGSHAFEVFYLVVPNEIIIAETSEPHTDKQRVGDFKIYAWEKEVQPDENHVVMVYLSNKGESGDYVQKLEQPINVVVGTSPDGSRLTIQYAAMAIAEAAEVPYNWDYSAQLADPQRRNYIEPLKIENKTAILALTDLLTPAGLSFRVDEQGIYLYDPKRFEQVEFLKPSKPDPLMAENLVAEGWKLWQQRKLSEAEDKFYQAARSDPKNDGAWQGLGWAQLNQGKKQNAEGSFKKCIELNPENSAALNGLGWIAHGQDKKDEAIEWWEKAVQAQPGATAALSGLTQTYMEMNDYAKAVKYYELWLKVEPDNEQAKEGLAKAKAMLD